MADINITDSLDAPVKPVDADVARLAKYLKSELLHFAVVPEFLELKNKSLPEAAPRPLMFSAQGQHDFTIGESTPAIDVTPGAKMTVRVNATPNSNLFAGDPFRAPATVLPGVAYVGAGFEGSLTLGVSGSSGNLSFGFEKDSGVSLQYWKAFPVGPEPTVLDALADTLRDFVVLGDISDLRDMGVGDVASVSGSGSLMISGGVKVSFSPNPLASVDLPLGAGTVAVKAGASAALSAEFSLFGSYEIRARKKDASTIELSFLQAEGSSFEADLSVSGGIAARFRDKDLIAEVLSAVSTDPTGDKKLLADLQPAEAKALAGAIKGGLNHSLQVSVKATLSGSREHDALFQYEIQPDLLPEDVKQAVNRALDGDLRQLTGLEAEVKPGGVIVPGLRMLSSVLSDTRERGLSMKLNLLGVVNLLTVSKLLQSCEVFKDEASGDLTITDEATATQISAVTDPLDKQAALRRAMYDATRMTTTYVASKAVSLPALACEQAHFVTHANTDRNRMAEYLTWFIPFHLMTREERNEIVAALESTGRSDCVLRAAFGDAECESMFLDANGHARKEDEYLNIARQALRAVLNAEFDATDALRGRLLSDATWRQAVSTGAVRELGGLVGIPLSDLRVNVLIGDIMDVTSWAGCMSRAAKAVRDMRSFLAGAEPGTLAGDPQFEAKRKRLQSEMADAVKSSKPRFDGPFGMVALYWAAGSPNTAEAKVTTAALTLQRSSPKAIAGPGV